ncbi:hypothetical protein KIW84_015307 [Lathyrus oleraceus]|uniref:Uncharacterized protein n=1 Tax=Pisum sativum TaxID=3888 RepID=A0A9D5BQK7_PEA|nr:hypothetical protein KIW84_015307 [Pisum sativum]
MDEALKGLEEYLASTWKKSQEFLQRALETLYRVQDQTLKHALDFIGSNHGEQPQSESDGGRENNDSCRDGVREESSVVTNSGGNDDNNENNNNIVFGNNDDNKGNRNNIVFGDNYSNIGGNDQEGSSYFLKVNIPKMNENNYNEWAQTVWLVLDSKGKFSFLTGAVTESTTRDSHYKHW